MNKSVIEVETMETIKINFYMKNGAYYKCSIDDGLTGDPLYDNTILHYINKWICKNFKNNATVELNDMKFTGNDILKIEICNKDNNVLATIENKEDK